MDFSLPHSYLQIPDTEEIVAFSINYERNFLACLTKKSLLLFDNSLFKPVLISTLTKFPDSFVIDNKNNWIEWITDEDLCYITQNGYIFISHIIYGEREQIIHDYDNNPQQKYLNRYQFIKILSPSVLTIFDSDQRTDHYVSSVFTAYEHIGICTSHSRIIFINKNGELYWSFNISNDLQPIQDAAFSENQTLFCNFNGKPAEVPLPPHNFTQKTLPKLKLAPLMSPSKSKLHYANNLLAIYYPHDGSLVIHHTGYEISKPPMVVYQPIENPQDNIDPVLNMFWDFNGNTLVIIHYSGAVVIYLVEANTTHRTNIDFVKSATSKNADLDTNQESIENKDFYFLFDYYGNRLFVSDTKSLHFIQFAKHQDQFFFTSVNVIDVSTQSSFENVRDLYPIQSVNYSAALNLNVVGNDIGFQLFRNQKPVSSFISVVPDGNIKRRQLVNVLLLGLNVLICIVSRGNFHQFEFNWENKTSQEEIFYSQFTYNKSQYSMSYVEPSFDEIKRDTKQTTNLPFDKNGPIESLFLVYYISFNNDSIELTPKLIIPTFYTPNKVDFFDDVATFSYRRFFTTLILYNPHLIYSNVSDASLFSITETMGLIFQTSRIPKTLYIKHSAISTCSSFRYFLSNSFCYNENMEALNKLNSIEHMNDSSNLMQVDSLINTRNPPIVYYHQQDLLNNHKRKVILSFFEKCLQLEKIPFACDAIFIYILNKTFELGSISFTSHSIAEYLVNCSLDNPAVLTYLFGYIYRKKGVMKTVISTSILDAYSNTVQNDSLSHFFSSVIPLLELNEIVDAFDELINRNQDKKVFVNIFNCFYKYINYHNKNLNVIEEKFAIASYDITHRAYSPQVVKINWSEFFGLMSCDTRKRIFLTMSARTFSSLVNKIDKALCDDALIEYFLTNNEILKAFLASNMNFQVTDGSGRFIRLFHKVILSSEEFINVTMETLLINSLKLMENEKSEWISVAKQYPDSFKILGCMFQLEGLEVFATSTFIVVEKKHNLEAVLISNNEIRDMIKKYSEENPDNMYQKVISDALNNI